MPTPSDHELEAHRIQNALIRKMTPAQRLAIAQDLYNTAWEIKKSALRRQYPDWTEAEIWAKTRKIFVTGYAGD